MKGNMMRKLSILAASALLAVAGSAYAGDKTGASAGADQSIQMNAADNSASGAVDSQADLTAGPANLGSVVSAINASSTIVSDIENLPEISGVTIVEVSELEGGADAQAIESAVTANEADVEALRSALASETSVTTALEAEGAATTDIVAADVDASGNLTVFTHRSG